MNREIKFRAWDKNRNLMCTSDIAGHWKTDYLLDLEMTVWDTSKGLSFDGIVEDTFEFMQYTGLKDKNGKEIYEGDIIQDKKGYKYKVNFANGKYTCRLLSRPRPNSLLSDCNEGCEVIGNIYENPELLTKQSEVLNMKGGEEVI